MYIVFDIQKTRGIYCMDIHNINLEIKNISKVYLDFIDALGITKRRILIEYNTDIRQYLTISRTNSRFKTLVAEPMIYLWTCRRYQMLKCPYMTKLQLEVAWLVIVMMWYLRGVDRPVIRKGKNCP